MSPVYNNTWWMCVFPSTGMMNPPPSEHSHLDRFQTWGCWRTYGKTGLPQQNRRKVRASKWRLSLGLKFGFRWYDGFKAGQRLNASVWKEVKTQLWCPVCRVWMWVDNLLPVMCPCYCRGERFYLGTITLGLSDSESSSDESSSFSSHRLPCQLPVATRGHPQMNQ